MKKLLIAGLLVVVSAVVAPAAADDDPWETKFTPRIANHEYGTVCISLPTSCPLYKG